MIAHLFDAAARRMRRRQASVGRADPTSVISWRSPGRRPALVLRDFTWGVEAEVRLGRWQWATRSERLVGWMLAGLEAARERAAERAEGERE